MIAEEKAKQLVNKMFNCDLSTPNEAMAMLYSHAKQCALISVELLIKYEGEWYDSYYWKAVKEEIINL